MTKTKKIAIFGGSFDPPHRGHLEIAEAALRARPDLDEIIFIPAGLPALKDIRTMTPSVYRYNMTKTLVRGLSSCRVSSLEVSRQGPSYTLDTVRHFLPLAGKAENLYFIAGYDVLFDLPKWHRPDLLLKSCTLLVGNRPGFSQAEVSRQKAFLEETYQARIEQFDMPQVDVSSTAVRRLLSTLATGREKTLSSALPETARLADGSFPLPAKIAEFCRQYELYQDHPFPEEVSTPVLQQFFLLQQSMWTEMSARRLLHSVSTGMLAMRLSLRFGVDPEKALLAGLLHDLAKEKNGLAWLADHPDEAYWLNDYRPVIHGAYGADLAHREWGIMDPDILAAIRYHTTLRAGASALEKIIFLADKIEYGRQYGDLEPIRKAAQTDLDRAVQLCLESVIAVMHKRKEPAHPFSVAALKELKH